MAGSGKKMGRREEAAMEALITQPTVEEAARVAKMGTQTLYRLLKNQDFATAVRKGRQAVRRQAIGRLQQSSALFVSALLMVMRDPNAPASARLDAVESALKHGKTAGEAEEMGARLAELIRAKKAAKQERLAHSDGAASGEGNGSSRFKGHGAKFPRRGQRAIVALLTERKVPEAARAAGISTPTLYRWMQEEEFAEAFLTARLAAFGRAGARLQQAAPEAVITILNIAGDPRTTPGMRVRAADLGLTYAGAASETDIEACVAELDCSRAVRSIRNSDRRTFGEMARARPRVAA
jgi:predicted DNA-binding transcriptional regulator AlpA